MAALLAFTLRGGEPRKVTARRVSRGLAVAGVCLVAGLGACGSPPPTHTHQLGVPSRNPLAVCMASEKTLTQNLLHLATRHPHFSQSQFNAAVGYPATQPWLVKLASIALAEAFSASDPAEANPIVRAQVVIGCFDHYHVAIPLKQFPSDVRPYLDGTKQFPNLNRATLKT